MNPVLALSAVKQAALIRDGELSSRDLIRAHVDRVAEVNPRINAAIEVCTGRATEPAAAADRRNAGAIPIARTNLPDLLFAFETDNILFGRTNNPYRDDYTSGGSSGGEAALIAACGSPMGLGSDCAGSVRIPAAFCGIASIKPT